MSGLSDAAIDRLRTVANWPEFTTDRYVITREIGRGGMGTVYAASDSVLGRDVAVKVANSIADGGFEDRLRAEAQVLARLEHPGIVPVHDAGRLADGRLYYVMKLVQGQTLPEHVRAHPDLGESLRVFERICEAVAFAHARGILHRDLKPDNVMIGPFGEVMVLDWGVARIAGAHEGSAVVGTRGFMAPEQAAARQVDERADVYSLGAILSALLTERSGVPPLRSISDRATAADPAQRYPSASALADDVARFRAGEAVLAHRETLLERGSRLAHAYQTPILLVLAYMIMRALVALATGR